MSQSLTKAIEVLAQSVDHLEKACAQSEAKAKTNRAAQHQNDLFGALYGKPSSNNSNNGGIDREAMTKVLDRTIARVEKMVEEA
mgnify:CR=1 FL=1